MAGSVTAYGLVMLLAAPTILTKVFGPSFAPAKVLVLPAVLAYIFDASNIGAALQLRAHARGKQLAAAQLVATLTRLVAVAALASTSGLLGAAWGLVIGSGGGAVTFWAVTRGAGRRHGIAEASGHLRVADPEGRI
jgi:O-antigen/teichoic acid export membrane protein